MKSNSSHRCEAVDYERSAVKHCLGLAAMVGATFLPLLLAGCAAYLHSPDLEVSTTAVKSKFDKLSAPTYFDAQEKNLADLAAREDRALAELLVTSRNYRLLNVISPASTAQQSSAVKRLREQVAEELDLTFGAKTLTQIEIDRLTTAPFLMTTANENLEFMREMVADRAARYKALGGTGKVDCKSVRGAPAADTTPGTPYVNLRSACDDLYNAEALASECTLGARSGALHALCIEGVSLRDDAAAKDRKEELIAAKKALEEALKVKDPENAAKDAADFLAKIAGLPEDEQFKSILSAIDTVFGDGLATTLDRLADEPAAKADSAAVPIANVLALLGAADSVVAATNKSAADQASALLIGLAKIRHEINILDLDIATRKQEAEIVDRQAAHLRKQLYFLAQAQESLTSNAANSPRAEAEGLTFYVRSLDVGRNPYELLTFRRSQLLRSAALKRARLTEADYRELIQPAIDQIAAYGAGGIKPETIGELLSGLPVAGSILAD